jgi:predicted phage-related endonuclease
MLQRSPEWQAIRAGKICASDAADMLDFTKAGKESYKRRDLRFKLMTERLTGQPTPSDYVNEAMQRGIDKEDDARSTYEAQTGALVDAVGFLEHDNLPAGCSPDGLVGDGLLELKCPKSATHARYLRTDALVDDYRAQLTHALWISGAPWIDIASFDDRFPADLAFVVVRLLAKDCDLRAHELAVRAFLAEVDDDVLAVRGWRAVEETA